MALATLERAVANLITEGLLRADSGRGTFVAQPPRPVGNLFPPDGRHPTTGTLAVLAPVQNPFFRHCVDELTVEAERRELKVVCHYRNRASSLADALDLEALQPVGYLLFNYDLAPVAAALLQRGHRAVVVGIPPVEVTPAVPCVYGDHEHGASLAARRLLDLGHRRIAFINDFNMRRRRRWHSHVQTLREAGIEETDTLIGPELLQSWREDPDALCRYFDSPDAPTGLVAWTDTIAVELLHLLRRAGLRAPEDVSVIGYDNLPTSAHSHPPLDTVDAHTEVQIRQALNLLFSPRGPGAVPTAVITPTLLCRHSCARPRD